MDTEPNAGLQTAGEIVHAALDAQRAHRGAADTRASPTDSGTDSRAGRPAGSGAGRPADSGTGSPTSSGAGSPTASGAGPATGSPTSSGADSPTGWRAGSPTAEPTGSPAGVDPVEDLVATALAAALGVAAIPRDRPFTALGGDSLMATRVLARIWRAFAVELPFGALIPDGTVRSLTAAVARARGAGARTRPVPLRRAARGAQELSANQAAVWFAQTATPGAGALYNIPHCLRLRGPLQPATLQHALSRLVRDHEALRLRFELRDGRLVQEPCAPTPVDLPTVDLASAPPRARERRALLLATRHVRAPLALHRPPLLRALLIRLADDDHMLVLAVHHIVCDAWSLKLLMEQLGEHCAAADASPRGARTGAAPARVRARGAAGPPAAQGAAGPPAAQGAAGVLAPQGAAGRPSAQGAAGAPAARSTAGAPVHRRTSGRGGGRGARFLDFVAWQRASSGGADCSRSIAAWYAERAALLAAPALPADHPRPALPSCAGAIVALTLAPTLVQRLRRLSGEHGVTLHMALLGAFAAVLARRAGGDCVVVGSPLANRAQPALEGVVGYLANMAPMRVECGGEQTLRELLGQARRAALAAHDRQALPFAQLVRELAPPRAPGVNPIFSTALTLNDLDVPALGAAQATPVLLHTGTAKLDLTLYLEHRAGGGLHGYLEYASDLFCAATIEHVRDELQRTLEGMVDFVDQSISAAIASTSNNRETAAVGPGR
jgi:hypothetical protein